MCDNGVGGMMLIEYPDKDERRLRWYTQSEYSIFKCKLLEDLCSISIQDDMMRPRGSIPSYFTIYVNNAEAPGEPISPDPSPCLTSCFY